MHNTVLTFGYVLARAAIGRKSVSMLDWGGGIGHYLLYAKALLPELKIDYHCKDVPALVEVGRRVLPEATFHESDSCLNQTYDLVMASGSLQYSQNWRAYLGRLGSSASRFLYVTRLPITQTNPTFAMTQRAQKFGYGDLCGWVVNEVEFLDIAQEVGLTLLREFIVSEHYCVRGLPETVQLRGFLFTRHASLID